ncbi:MAG: glycosyltransferase, partial [Bacteroidota bacterium]
LLFILFLLATAYQFLFLLVIFPRAKKATSLPNTSQKPTHSAPVSIILCFRNEVGRLRKYLPLLLNQDYANFEVLAINDHSTDGSSDAVTELLPRYPHLRLLTPPKPTRPGKKDALSFGIAQAQYDIFLLTDADCAPASNQWLKLMTLSMRSLSIGHQSPINLVLGFSPYRYASGWVNSFQRFETLYTAFQYIGLAKMGKPYMGVGRNLAYQRSFFEAADGFASHVYLAGGDDDLLISHHAKARRTAVCIVPSAWTWSEPATGLKDYLRRKFRHLSVGGHYPWLIKLILAGLAISHVSHYFLATTLLLVGDYYAAAISCVFLRWVAILFIYRTSLYPIGTQKSQATHYHMDNRAFLFSYPRLIINDILLVIYFHPPLAR